MTTGNCKLGRVKKHERRFGEQSPARTAAEFAIAPMAELFSRRRANRSRAFLGRLSRFERMAAGPRGFCPDLWRFGYCRDADSGRSGDRRTASQTDAAGDVSRSAGCLGVPPDGES